MHISIPTGQACEMINVQPTNPLISRCQIKVCYVSDEPNRNRTVITKEVAARLANSLPGSPIVGHYSSQSNDYEEHNKIISVSNGKYELAEDTFPYGFVDIGAKVWFQKFLDDNEVEREYLMTEGYLWTGQYPDCERVIKQGNNQSMELDGKSIKGEWAKDDNGNLKFFIINDGLISKLCILGQEFEPCFEGAHITKPQFTFSCSDGFKESFAAMITEMQESLQKGGAEMQDENMTSSPIVEEELPVEEYKKKDDEEEKKDNSTSEEQEDKTEQSDSEKKEDKEQGKDVQEDTSDSKEDKKDDEEDEDKKKKKKEFSLEEVPEFIALQEQYNTLFAANAELQATVDRLTSENAELTQFRNQVETERKQAMVDSFYMLDDTLKADVVAHMDEYSVSEIEEKLSVICVRNKVSFDLDAETNSEPFTFSLTDTREQIDSDMPEWAKEVLKTQNRQ